MNSQEILRALRAGEISLEAAKIALTKFGAAPAATAPRVEARSSAEPSLPPVRGRAKPAADARTQLATESIAIIGMSGRYPNAPDLNRYWDNLAQAKNCIQEIPPSRWDVNRYYDPRPSQKGKVYCKWIGLLEDIEYFDPLFFMISPAEAELMDPQHRVFLQEGYRAFEDAGYNPQSLSNRKCGVYLGIMGSEYVTALRKNTAGAMNITGNNLAIAAARISYFLNLKGPAIAIDTACSSSLVATHLACQALLNREIDMALAGGVSLYLTEDTYLGMCAAGMLSPDGQCKTFDNSADGFVPGEGVGALVLKRLSDAEADHDTIYGVIIGSGINQDGKTNGITAPSVNSQIELVRDIYQRYHIHPDSISYVEMHGTGTKLGDPIELEALSTVFQAKTERKNYCAIGSVKSNIGHTLVAAGMASLHKTLLCLKNNQIVPSLNFHAPNEHFDFARSPFYVNTQLKPWLGDTGAPRRAAVSSFGYSGTNAHLVIEEYRAPADRATTPVIVDATHPIVFVLSAKSAAQLRAVAAAMKDWLDAHPNSNLADLAYTLQVGRDAMEYRLAFLADSKDALQKRLQGFLDEQIAAGVFVAHIKKSSDEIAIFRTDDDAKALLQTWIGNRKLEKVAELWAKGVEVEWSQLYPDIKPRRIALPTYPFAREYCWAVGVAAPAAPMATSTAAKTELVFSQPIWQSRPLATIGGEQPLLTQGDIFIFLCADTLRAQVDLAHAFAGGSAAADIFELTYSQANADMADEYQGICREVFVRLKQHLATYPRHAVQVLLVSDAGAKGVIYHNGLLALLKSIQHERAEIKLKAIQVAAELLSRREDFTAILRQELNGDAVEDIQVRYLVSAAQPEAMSLARTPPAPAAANLSFAEHDLFWITGGMGALAQWVAGDLIRRGIRNIFLTGRSSLTPDKTRELKRLSEANPGVTVEYHRADVARGEDVERLIAVIGKRQLKLTGIIHSAGVIDDAAIEKKTAEQFQAVLAPKAQGVENIDKFTRNERLDYFVLFSSIAGIAGNFGQSDYACANAFLDGFAQYRNKLVKDGKRYGKTISINWPYWAEGGMALDKRLQEAMAEQGGIAPLSTQNGLSALNIALQQAWDQVVVTEVTAGAAATPWEKNINRNRMPAKRDAAAAGATSIRGGVIDILSQVTKIPVARIQPDQELHELGLDSIVIMQLLNEVMQRFGVRIYLPEMHELKSVQQFVHYIETEVGVHASEQAPIVEAPIKAGKKAPTKRGGAREGAGKLAAVHSGAPDKTRKTIFVLGTPRAGSTLLRVMLGGNRKIFSPPELYLLGHRNMKERADILAQRKQTLFKEGLVEAIHSLVSGDVSEAKALVAKFEEDQASIASVYRYLHAHLGDRYLVDKTPMYGHSAACLQQAEQETVQPMYLYLYRHPLAVMGSLVKNRFHKMLQLEGEPWEIAERIWSTWNDNIAAFLRDIPAQRQIHIPYEAMVAEPAAWMQLVCERLGIEYDAGMIRPYDSDKNMTRGLHAESLMVGDPNFLTHSDIDANLAFAWRAHWARWSSLQASTVGTAASLGYSVEGDGFAVHGESLEKPTALLPAQAAFFKIYGDDPVWHIVTEVTLESTAPLSADAIRKNYLRLLQKYSSLRTRYKRSASQWRPHVEPAAVADAEGNVFWLDARKLSKNDLARERGELLARMQKKIDIAAGSVLAVAVIQLEQDRYRCVLVLHHLAGDGFSMQMIINGLFNETAPVQLANERYRALLQLYRTPSFIDRFCAYWQRAENSPATLVAGKKACASNRYRDEVEYREVVSLSKRGGRLAADRLNWEGVAAALYAALAQTSKHKELTVSHRLHRRDLAGHSKMADDVGYYAGDVPITLEAAICADANAVGHRLRGIRADMILGGAEYELLANLQQIKPVHELTTLRLNYQPPSLFGNNGSIRVVDADTFLYQPDDHTRLYELDCIVRQGPEDLVFIIRYNKQQYAPDRIQSLVRDWLACLRGDAGAERLLGVE